MFLGPIYQVNVSMKQEVASEYVMFYMHDYFPSYRHRMPGSLIWNVPVEFRSYLVAHFRTMFLLVIFYTLEMLKASKLRVVVTCTCESS